MSQDVYRGRKAKNPGAASALEQAYKAPEDGKPVGQTMGWKDAKPQVGLLTWGFVGPVGLEPTTRGLKVRCSAN
jgi:hypothetical protein